MMLFIIVYIVKFKIGNRIADVIENRSHAMLWFHDCFFCVVAYKSTYTTGSISFLGKKGYNCIRGLRLV